MYLHESLNDKEHIHVMDHLGAILSDTYEFMDKFSFQTIMQIGIQMIEMIQEFHSTGYVYNDLKPENICIGEHENDEELHILKLIDFGLCTKYIING